MAIITLSAGACLPKSALGAALAAALPRWRWTCGDDIGDGCGLVAWRPHQMIFGRAGDEPLFIELAWHDQPCHAPAPGHAAHLVIGRPTTDDARLAEQVMAIIAAEILRADNGQGSVRFEPDGPWLDLAAVDHLLPLVTNGEPLALVAGCAPSQPAAATEPAPADKAPAPFAAPVAAQPPIPFDDLLPADRSARLGIDVIGMAQAKMTLARTMVHNPTVREVSPLGRLPAFLDELPRPDRLPTLAVLFDAAPAIDRELLAEGLRAVDPRAGWTIDAEPDGLVARAGAFAIRLDWQPVPLPDFLLELALWRSFWCRPGAALGRLRRHGGTLAITCDLDCDGGRAPAVRQAAKAMTVALAVAARSPGLAGFYNAAANCAWTADDADRLVAALGSDEVPIKLFVWTAFHATEADAVSISTAGMLPFAGYEVEAWNAPGTLDWVGEQFSGVLRYLLIEGPCIGHGDTIGHRAGDRGIRCFHGPSQAGRADAAPALLLEFAGPDQAAAPPPPRREPLARPAPAPFARRAAGGFGRKGL